MIHTIQYLKTHAVKCIDTCFTIECSENDILINETKPGFDGDLSIVTFALSKQLKQKPDVIAQQLGEQILTSFPTFYKSFNVVQGFLNIVLNDEQYLNYLHYSISKDAFICPQQNKNVMVEFSSPNTNKPLHFGHLRNNFLGESVSRILTATGHKVTKANLLNDRGIHICKSMFAWLEFGKGETPESSNKKGDHLVGYYYVLFENENKKQAQQIVEQFKQNQFEGCKNDEQITTVKKLLETLSKTDDTNKLKDIKSKITEIAKTLTPYMQGARDLLVKWEMQDEPTMKLWKEMNSWVIAGFESTYKKLDIQFDQYYYESETYLLGKEIVLKGLEKGQLFKKENGSIWIDLTADGLDEKLLLRGDGTSVYITQDIGTAKLKFDEFQLDQSIYVIADEQNYHIQVLKLVLEKLAEPAANGIHHLSYGLVELPNGRMKTREGTVVDADDIIQEMIDVAAKHTLELGKVDGFTESELIELYNTIGLGALKFFLLRVDPKKKMIFNPEESIDFHGFTGPFIQYAFARTSAILRKNELPLPSINTMQDLLPGEKIMIKNLETYPSILMQASKELSPALICNYAFSLAKQLNSFLADHKVITAETEAKKELRLQICIAVKQTLKHSMHLLGINLPEKM